MSRKGYFVVYIACMGAASLALVPHRWWTGRYESKKGLGWRLARGPSTLMIFNLNMESESGY